MKIKPIIAGLFVLTAFSAVVAFACDNTGPSQSVGACDTKTTCSDFTSQSGCTGGVITAYEINQDFPTSCITVTNSLCNTPNAHCSIVVSCQWVNGACGIVPGSDSGHLWDDKPKKTAGTCSG
jgi:hypothetical protein